jgi:hypothetical protein
VVNRYVDRVVITNALIALMLVRADHSGFVCKFRFDKGAENLLSRGLLRYFKSNLTYALNRTYKHFFVVVTAAIGFRLTAPDCTLRPLYLTPKLNPFRFARARSLLLLGG